MFEIHIYWFHKIPNFKRWKSCGFDNRGVIMRSDERWRKTWPDHWQVLLHFPYNTLHLKLPLLNTHSNSFQWHLALCRWRTAGNDLKPLSLEKKTFFFNHITMDYIKPQLVFYFRLMTELSHPATELWDSKVKWI